MEDQISTRMDKSTMLLLLCHSYALIAIRARALRLYLGFSAPPAFPNYCRSVALANRFPIRNGFSRSSGTASARLFEPTLACASWFPAMEVLRAASIPLKFRLKWQRNEVHTMRCFTASHRERWACR